VCPAITDMLRQRIISPEYVDKLAICGCAIALPPPSPSRAALSP